MIMAREQRELVLRRADPGSDVVEPEEEPIGSLAHQEFYQDCAAGNRGGPDRPSGPGKGRDELGRRLEQLDHRNGVPGTKGGDEQ